MDNPANLHKPVLLNEVLEGLNIKKGNTYVDCTLGLGGHSYEILQKLENTGSLIGIEQDNCALELATNRLKDFKNCSLFNENYSNIAKVLKNIQIDQISGGLLLDLGISSLQLDDPTRGFSLLNDGPLDMRMDQNNELTAADIVNKFKEKELADIIYTYGEERFSRRIARYIVNERPINSTLKLANIVKRSIPYKKYTKTHPATKTFQAIRIFVNNELKILEEFLRFIPELLFPQSRLSVISFHSLEDRIVKIAFRESSDLKIITKKPICPTDDEVKTNPRSRSAKLRIAEKISTLTAQKTIEHAIPQTQVLNSLVVNTPYRFDSCTSAPVIPKSFGLPFGIRTNVLEIFFGFYKLTLSSLIVLIACSFLLTVLFVPIKNQNLQLLNSTKNLTNNKYNLLASAQEIANFETLFKNASSYSFIDANAIKYTKKITHISGKAFKTAKNKQAILQFSGF